MEEKKEIKITLGTIICIIIIIILLLAIGGLYYYNHVKEKQTSNSNTIVTSNSITNSIENNKTINKIDSSKDIVYTGVSKITSKNSYVLPVINLNYDNIKAINKDIESKDLDCWNVSYKSYLNDSVLSIVITYEGYTDNNTYSTYNIDVYTGKIYKNSELLLIKNISNSDFTNELPTIYSNAFIKQYGTKESYINGLRTSKDWTEKELENQSGAYSDQYNKTIASNNFDNNIEDMQMFLDENNTINIVGRIYSLAGAEAYDRIINTGI